MAVERRQTAQKKSQATRIERESGRENTSLCGAFVYRMACAQPLYILHAIFCL
jgi:hypothetical protein